MYSRLMNAWTAYNEATQAMPYNPDHVQGLGLAFAYRLNMFKDRLCADLGIDPDEFSYSMKYQIMEKLNEIVGILSLLIVFGTLLFIAVGEISDGEMRRAHIEQTRQERCYNLGMVLVETEIGPRCVLIKDLVK